ncbi:MAG: hypothetical protein GF417_11975 [Candidatus Latescibacteria bacterium]|nr:hypothetical protein [bacterium]MBD3425144.1 hypothetical protein [Candidatus Latescibacterota bacterium]
MSSGKEQDGRAAGAGMEHPAGKNRKKAPDANLDRINQLRRELRRKDELLQMSLDFAAKFSSHSDIELISRKISISLSGNLGVEKVAVYTPDAGGKDQILRHELGRGMKGAPESLYAGSSFLRWLNTQEQPALIDSYFNAGVQVKEAEAGWLEDLIREGYSYLSPLDSGSEISGLAFFSGKVNGDNFKERDRELIRVISVIGAAALGTVSRRRPEQRAAPEELDFHRFKEDELARRSFELNTPLTVLKSTLWSVETGMTGEGLMIDMARDAVSNLQEKIGELAGISELRYSTSKLNLKKTDITAIMDDSLRKFIPEIEQKFSTVDYSEKMHREILVDPGKMELALTAVIKQVVEQVSPGGRIVLSTSFSEKPPGEREGVEMKVCSGSVGDGEDHNDSLDRELSEIGAGSWFIVRAGWEAGNDRSGLNAGQQPPSLRIAFKIISDHGGRVYVNGFGQGDISLSIWLPA